MLSRAGVFQPPGAGAASGLSGFTPSSVTVSWRSVDRGGFPGCSELEGSELVAMSRCRPSRGAGQGRPADRGPRSRPGDFVACVYVRRHPDAQRGSPDCGWGVHRRRQEWSQRQRDHPACGLAHVGTHGPSRVKQNGGGHSLAWASGGGVTPLFALGEGADCPRQRAPRKARQVHGRRGPLRPFLNLRP